MDKNEIRELMRFFDKSEITKLKIKEGDFTIELQKGFESGVTYTSTPVISAPVAQHAAPAAQASETDSALATKLALAQEFLGFGDKDSARVMIQEVAQNATGDLQAQAQALLQSIG